MRLGWASATALVAIGCANAFAQGAVTKPRACLDVQTSVLRLDALSATIEACTFLIQDRNQPRRVQAEAIGQRGVLHARRWGLTDSARDAHQAIVDISAALDFRVLENGKVQQLLIWRGTLYEGVKQPAKAGDDYRAVLRIAPFDETARAALLRLGVPSN